MRQRTRAAVFSVLAALAGEREARAQRAGGASSPPRVVRLMEAAYPPEALRRGEGAVVRLELDLDDAGRVTRVAVVGSSGRAAFDEAAVAAAREFEFEPARRDGRPVPARIRYAYRFTPPAPRAADEDAPRPQPATAPARPPAPRAPAMDEGGVTVFARVPSREIGRREVTAEEIRRIPGARGDALLAVQNLPGVARPPFGLGQFVVRSSPPEDSLVLLEGQPIALPFHFGGLATTVATDLIERIEFLPGNFSARYGRVAGGVINVTLRAPPRDRVHAVADVDPIDAGVYASTPLGRGASLAVGARASYLHLLAPLVVASGGGTSFRQWPAYGDYQLALDWDLSRTDSLRIVATGSDDRFVLDYTDPNANDPNVRGEVGTHLGFHGVQARWRHRFAPRVVHTFAPALSYTLTSASLGPEVRFEFHTAVASLRDELELGLGPRARLFLGLDAQAAYSDNAVRAPPVSNNGITDPIDPSTVVTYIDRRSYLNPAAYLEAEVDPVDALRVLAGVRVDHYGLLGATTLNPRAMARLTLHPRLALRAGAGLYGTPPRGWAIIPGFGNPDLQPEQWVHATAGMSVEIVQGVVEFDTNAFIKLGDRVVVPSTGMRRDRQGVLLPERFANTGTGRVIGGEWLLRVRPGRAAPAYALVSYTLQRAVRAACEGCPAVTYEYDQPHILSVVLGALLPHGWEVGGRFRYTSGIVEPAVTGALYDADHDVALTLVDPLRPGRLPPFVSVDVRASWRFTLGPLRAQAILEVLNALNNNNPESRIYSYDRRESRLVYGLPILPSLGLRAEY
jgi:TonB family protein